MRLSIFQRQGRAPAATTILLLALGLGATTAVFAVREALLLRPLPVAEAERLIVPYAVSGERYLQASTLDVEAWRQAAALSGLAAAALESATLDDGADGGEPERIAAAKVEAGYLSVLGVEPLLGRRFESAEVRAGARVALLGYGLWQRRFAGAATAVGQRLQVDEEEWEVIGVLPAGFDQPFAAELWRPLDLEGQALADRSRRVLTPVGRLAPGVTLEQAGLELAAISRRVEQELPATHSGWQARVLPLRDSLMGDFHGRVRRAVELMLWGALLLFAITCTNVAQLLTVRAVERRGEFGLRLALGASPLALARRLALESLGFVAVGGLLSLPCSWLLAAGVLRLAPIAPTAFSADLLAVSYSPRVLLAALGLAFVAALVVAVAPASQALRSQPLSGRGESASPRQKRFFELAVGAQVAVTVALLACAASLAEGFVLLSRLDLGFQLDGLVSYELPLTPALAKDAKRRAELGEQLSAAASQLPGVESAGFTTTPPLANRSYGARFLCEGKEPADPAQTPMAADRLVGPGYLETLGVRLLAGRLLTSADDASGLPVVVVNQAVAAECWPGAPEAALGKRLRRAATGRRDWLTVVGVIADTRELRQSFRQPHAVWYLPYRQHDFARDLYLVARVTGDPVAIAPALRSLARRFDSHLPLGVPRPLTTETAELLGPDRTVLWVILGFAALGTLLAAVGLYGSLARHVGRQRRAIGIRMALGAAPGRIGRAVVGRGLATVALGTAAGLTAALALEPLLSELVYGRVLGLPARCASIAVLVFLLALLAAAVPARRAAKLEPRRLLAE